MSFVAGAIAAVSGCGLLWFAASGAAWPIVGFPAEEITVTVHPSYIEVDGRYLYANPWPMPVDQGFGLPFPVDEAHPTPLPVRLSLADQKTALPIKHLLGSRYFNVSFAPQQNREVDLYYRQEAHDNTATYILKTTQSWGRPLEKGVYRLVLRDVKNVRSNFPLTQVKPDLFVFEQRNFMPSTDWTLSWEPTGEKR